MRLTVSGLPGSGTTSLARYLSEQHNLTLVSAGEVFRQMANEGGFDLASFGELARSDPSIDRLIDERQKGIAARSDDIILEGRLSGWMVPDADLKVWLMAPLKCRIDRIYARDELNSEEEALRATEEREKCEKLRYMIYYQIDISDLSQYHIVLNSARWDVSQLGAIVSTAIAEIKGQICKK
jgi:cytidylate kinase